MQSAWTLLSWGPEGWLDDLAHGVFITVSLALATLPIGLFDRLLRRAGQTVAASPRCALPATSTPPSSAACRSWSRFSSSISAPRSALQSLIHLVDPEATIEINSFISGMVALGVVFSSYASEVFLSAFRAIPHGQYEGGYAIGLTRGQTMRLVVLPQLIRIALPGLANLWLILLKDTALVSAIGLADILRQAGIAARVTKHALPVLRRRRLIYLVLAIISSFGIHAIERAVGQPGGRPVSAVAEDHDRRRAAAAGDCPRLAARTHRRPRPDRPVDPGTAIGARRLSGAWPGTQSSLPEYAPRYLSGLGVTLSLVVDLDRDRRVLSCPIAYARMSRNPVLSGLAYAYVYFFRGTPLLAQTFLVYYGLGSFRPQLEAIGLWEFFREAWYCAIFAFALNTAAYQAEILRGAIESVPKGQWEGAASLGLHKFQTLLQGDPAAGADRRAHGPTATRSS